MCLIDRYFCVFIGDPTICTPYAMFATEEQALIFAKNVLAWPHIMTLQAWMRHYSPTSEAAPSSPEPDPSPAEQTKPASH